MKYKIKRFLSKHTWAKWCLGLLAVVLVAGVILKATGTAATPIDFVAGSLTQDGEYQSSTSSIVTREKILVEHLIIDRSFGSEVTFDLFFYDENGEALQEKLTGSTYFDADAFMADTANAAFASAKYCRIIVHPNDDNTDISRLDVIKYASKLTIKHDK